MDEKRKKTQQRKKKAGIGIQGEGSKYIFKLVKFLSEETKSAVD